MELDADAEMEFDEELEQELSGGRAGRRDLGYQAVAGAVARVVQGWRALLSWVRNDWRQNRKAELCCILVHASYPHV